MSSVPSKPCFRMPLTDALRVVLNLRQDEIVVTTMGSAREWPKLAQHPLDFHYVPSAMGHAPMIGLGLALAQPARQVIAFNGDGCMLMSLGCLVTIVASGAKNLTLIVLDNGIYEVTGGQQTAATFAGTDFAGLARAAGFSSVAAFDDLTTWQQQAAATLALPGPRFISLAIEPVGPAFHLEAPGPMGERVPKFIAAVIGKSE